MRAPIRIGLLVATCASMATCLAACGSSVRALDSTKIERAIARSVLSEHDLYTRVSCPSRVPQEAGRKFTCDALLQVGAYPVTVTETNSSGHVRYEDRRPLMVLNIAKVEHAIEVSILRQRHVGASAVCPAQVMQQAGLTFDCTTVINATRASSQFLVRELDDHGDVQYLGT